MAGLYQKTGGLDFLCSLTTFCAGLVSVQLLCKALVVGLAQKVPEK
jgi:hypothetical protein